MEAKLLLLSVVIMMVLVPVLAARDTSAHRGMRRTILVLAAFNVLYFLAIKYVYVRIR
jgi:hypothetical protein